MAKLVFHDGKFFRGSEEVPPVIGDAEQIALLQKHERECTRQEYLRENGEEIDVEVNVTAEADYKCSCGSWVFFGTTNCDSEDSALWELDQQTKTCRCGKKYEIHQLDDDSWIVIEQKI